MKIFYKEIELDSSVEHELFANSKFGYNAIITFNHNGIYNGKWLVTNLTEIHNKFETFDDHNNKIAFESDIHGTGRTNYIHHIETLEIVDATKKFEKFWYNLSQE